MKRKQIYKPRKRREINKKPKIMLKLLHNSRNNKFKTNQLNKWINY